MLISDYILNVFQGPNVEIIYFEIYNPRPIPSLLSFVHYPKVLYSPPSFSITSAVIPEPVSLTSKYTNLLYLFFLKTRNLIPPFLVNFMAFPIKFSKI